MFCTVSHTHSKLLCAILKKTTFKVEKIMSQRMELLVKWGWLLLRLINP